MFLEKQTFMTVIDNTPLVSIDLVVINEKDEVLLGRRLNRPAKGSWFVPGGRILKNEALADAFKRLTLEELSKQYLIENACLLGPYDHFYTECVFNNNISTHYVAIAYILKTNSNELNSLPVAQQHSNYSWFAIEALLENDEVHTHTKLYLQAIDSKGI
jgi:colanic acid biosynthesis protein WcaH